jgi:hypothetical protein
VVDVRPERSQCCENHADERLSACVAPDVRRGDLVHKAKDQSFVTERIWAYQTKSAFSDGVYIVSQAWTRNEKGTAFVAPCLSHVRRSDQL